nr:MAG TPA: hypothetical protein [Caudoviricetes sp.]
MKHPLSYQYRITKKSQRPCWCQRLERSDKRPKKQPKNKYIFYLFNKIS